MPSGTVSLLQPWGTWQQHCSKCASKAFFFKLKISQWVMFWSRVEFRDKREEFHSWISPSLDTYLKWDVSILPPPSAGHFDYCRKPLFHPISTRLLLSHTVICIFLSWLSSTSFSASCHTCYSLVLFFPSFPPVFLFPPSLWQRTTSSKCTARHELSTCFGAFFY